MVESGILPSAFHFVSVKLVCCLSCSAKIRLAGEKPCSRWRYYVEWYIGVAHDACRQRRRTRQTCLVLSSQVPPPVFANATRHLRTLSGDDKSRLYSRVFPSWRFSSSTSLTTPHSTRKHSSLQGFRVRRHHQPQNNGSQARRYCSHNRPWQNRVKTLLIGAIGVSFEQKADSPNC